MQFKLATILAVLTAFTYANPVPEAEAEPVAAAGTLQKRDNWCKVLQNVRCREGPSTSYRQKPGREWVYPGDRFGVSCTREGENISGDATWDYIPGWDCYISAYYSRSAGSQRTCETGLNTCRGPI
ncbi:hypothetical protein EJ08DRAFT_395057 [Tothia fuscella]|uniref:Uncharacterized protein n=1 Tax=Tothia fuscella TaxID=1048955 RepID=A0A9P4U3T1_9PEZI|nr:hypothetical protein EJ08DRAFT_395057 [Tothia fuscella]